MGVNMDSTYYLARAVLPHMQANRYGRIITTVSATASHPEPGLAAYAASKSAVIAFTRALATEATSSPASVSNTSRSSSCSSSSSSTAPAPLLDITANTVAPGLIRTDTSWSSPDARPIFDKVVARQCMKRYGQPEDVARAFAFLADRGSAFVTGQTIHVYGGLLFG